MQNHDWEVSQVGEVVEPSKVCKNLAGRFEAWRSNVDIHGTNRDSHWDTRLCSGGNLTAFAPLTNSTSC